MCLTLFSKKSYFLFLFPTASNIRFKAEEKEKMRKRGGNAETGGAQKLIKLNNAPRMENISMKRTSVYSKMVQ